MFRRSVIKVALWTPVALFPVAMAGCAAAGFVAQAIPQSVKAEYPGLAGQKVAVMVWADRGARIDFPNLQLDTANQIQADLASQVKDKSELAKTEFPWEARSVLRFQKEHPEVEMMPVTSYAQRISGITRLIYVEVSDFSTRNDVAVQLLRGSMGGNVKVVEITNGVSKIVYERSNIRVTFPEKSPDGVINVSEDKIYAGTVTSFADTVSKLFYGYVVERDTH